MKLTFVFSFKISRFDCCISALSDLLSSTLEPLASVLYTANKSACLTKDLCNRDHITTILQQLHWLFLSVTVSPSKPTIPSFQTRLTPLTNTAGLLLSLSKVQLATAIISYRYYNAIMPLIGNINMSLGSAPAGNNKSKFLSSSKRSGGQACNK